MKKALCRSYGVPHNSKGYDLQKAFNFYTVVNRPPLPMINIVSNYLVFVKGFFCSTCSSRFSFKMEVHNLEVKQRSQRLRTALKRIPNNENITPLLRHPLCPLPNCVNYNSQIWSSPDERPPLSSMGPRISKPIHFADSLNAMQFPVTFAQW